MKVYLLTGANGTDFTGITRYTRPFIKVMGDKTNLICARVIPLAFMKRLKSSGLRIPGLLKEFFVTVDPEPDNGSILYISDQTLGACLLWKKYKKVIVAIHDLAPLTEYNLFGALKFGFLDRIVTTMSIKAVGRADVIITFSQFTKREILKYLHCPENKVKVIYPGIGKEFGHYPVGKSGTNILYVGSEEPRKNLELLIRAFARMRKKNNKLKLIKVGRSRWTSGRDRIESLIKSLGLTQAVVFKEYVDDLVSVYNTADVFVFPSLYEGFGSPVVEAMACGLPVVCSNAASLPELAGDAAVMFDPHNECELAEKVLDVLASPEKQEQMRERGLERAKLFSWEKHAEVVLDLCRKLL